MSSFSPSFEEVLALPCEQPNDNIEASPSESSRLRRITTSLGNIGIELALSIERTAIYVAAFSLTSETVADTKFSVTTLAVAGMISNFTIHTLMPLLQDQK